MEPHNNEEQKILNAKKRLRRLKLFYIHFTGYLVIVALLVYNLYIVEGVYKNDIALCKELACLYKGFISFYHGSTMFHKDLLVLYTDDIG